MYLGAPANEYFQPSIRIDEGIAEVRLRVRPDFFHAANAVHGSVYFKLLDDATFFATASIVRDVFILTASFELSFLRPVTDGEMIATGRFVREEGRRLAAEGIVLDAEGRELARGTGTFARSRMALSAEMGYR